MRYLGGKARLAKDLGPFLTNQLAPGACFVDLFAGSCNVVANVSSDYVRYANDINEDIITTMRAAASGFQFPTEVTEEEYRRMRLEGTPSDPLYGFMAYGCSFVGKRWGGYARSKSGAKNYAKEASNTLKRIEKNLQTTKFSVGSYLDFKIPDNAVVYCDIPYSNTTKYLGRASGFNHQEFYRWVDQQTCDVFISEYATGYNPLNLSVVWQKESRQRMGCADGTRRATIEVLFHKPAS